MELFIGGVLLAEGLRKLEGDTVMGIFLLCACALSVLLGVK